MKDVLGLKALGACMAAALSLFFFLATVLLYSTYVLSPPLLCTFPLPKKQPCPPHIKWRLLLLPTNTQSQCIIFCCFHRLRCIKAGQCWPKSLKLGVRMQSAWLRPLTQWFRNGQFVCVLYRTQQAALFHCYTTCCLIPADWVFNVSHGTIHFAAAKESWGEGVGEKRRRNNYSVIINSLCSYVNIKANNER